MATPQVTILTENEQLVGINAEYEERHGFHDAENYLYEAPKGPEPGDRREGLRVQVRAAMDARLQTESARPLPSPQPADVRLPDAAELGYDDIRYFVRASEAPSRSWDDVPEDVKRTFDCARADVALRCAERGSLASGREMAA